MADSFRIMKYEFTNQQYTDFLNSVAKTDTYSLYSTIMGSDVRGGITRSGSSGSYSYSVKSNMGDKPVNHVSWFDAARVANWLQNGATSSSSTETGAYTLSGSTDGNAMARNPGAKYFIPTENQWYKAAFYKGGSLDADYWQFATQTSGTAPISVGSTLVGSGSSGGVSPVVGGNFANYNYGADWNSENGNVTTVGTNGGPSAYGAFDMSGNLFEWNDLTGVAGRLRGLRGGSWNSSDAGELSRVDVGAYVPDRELDYYGFRLASSVPIPEIEPSGLGVAVALTLGLLALLERRRSGSAWIVP